MLKSWHITYTFFFFNKKRFKSPRRGLKSRKFFPKKKYNKNWQKFVKNGLKFTQWMGFKSQEALGLLKFFLVVKIKGRGKLDPPLPYGI